MCALIMVALLALFGLSAFQTTSVGESEPVITAGQATCPVTLPNGMTPPGEEASPAHHGNGRLYTVLTRDGEIRADDRSREANGTIGWKLPVWRAPGVGEAGDLEITEHELTMGAEIRVVIRSGEASLAFTTRVSGTGADAALTP